MSSTFTSAALPVQQDQRCDGGWRQLYNSFGLSVLFLFWALDPSEAMLEELERLIYLRAGTTLSMAIAAPLWPPPLVQFRGIHTEKKKKQLCIKSPEWAFVHSGKSLSRSWIYTLLVQMFHLPVQGFALDPLEDVLGPKGRSWEKALEFNLHLCPRYLEKMKVNNQSYACQTVKWAKVASKDSDTSPKSSSSCCLQKLKQLRWEGLFMLHLSDQHSVSHRLSNHLLPAKGALKNFIFASRFSASPFPSSATPSEAGQPALLNFRI